MKEIIYWWKKEPYGNEPVVRTSKYIAKKERRNAIRIARLKRKRK